MTITPMLDDRAKKGNYHPVVIYVYYKGKKRFVKTGYKIEAKYWKGEVIKHPDAPVINSKISAIVSRIKTYYAECMLKGRPVDLALVDQERAAYSFNDYLLHRAGQYNEKEMIIPAKRASRLEYELREFKGTIYFEDINADTLRSLDAWYLKRSISANTRHKKFNDLSRFYKDAIDDGKAPVPNPFKKYKIITKPVKKEKLTVEQLTSIENLCLQPGIVNDARNLFLFSYYCKGARFETCITMLKKQVGKERIEFKTNKGEKYLSVKIHPRLANLVSYYKKSPGPFLFPFLSEHPENKRAYISTMNSWNTYVNRQLKIIAGLAGIKINLSMHIARHSFAFHLKQNSDNIHVIQEALGHSRQVTTETYLKALGDEVLDKEMEKLYGA